MAGMLNNMANLANAKLTADLSSSATTVTLDDASPFANLGTFYATIMPAGEMSRLSNSEIVRCDYASSTTLAITRAQRGTSARAFTSGAILTNGIYVEDLEQAQYVGDGVFDTSYNAGVYTITTNKDMLPAIPSDGMKINVRINTDSSGTPGLDLQGTGAIYSIYSGTLVNNDGAAHATSEGAALLAGETYELVFDAEVGGGCWKATGLVQLADVPFYEQAGSGSNLIEGSDIDWTTVSSANIGSIPIEVINTPSTMFQSTNVTINQLYAYKIGRLLVIHRLATAAHTVTSGGTTIGTLKPEYRPMWALRGAAQHQTPNTPNNGVLYGSDGVVTEYPGGTSNVESYFFGIAWMCQA